MKKIILMMLISTIVQADNFKITLGWDVDPNWPAGTEVVSECSTPTVPVYDVGTVPGINAKMDFTFDGVFGEIISCNVYAKLGTKESSRALIAGPLEFEIGAPQNPKLTIYKIVIEPRQLELLQE